MATKKNNTKKANNKPETKEEIVEIKEKENIGELVELTDEDTEEITNFLKDKGMDDEFINNVLNNEELEETVKALMGAEQNKPSLKERFKKFASDKKEAIQNAAIVVGATAAICGVVYAVCNVADDDVEEDIPLNMEPGDNALYINDLRDDEVEEITDYLTERGFTKKDPEEVFDGDNNANEAEEA